MGRVSGKMAIVTGAAQGLGAAISKMLVKEGAKVLLTDLNGEGVEKLAEEINAHSPGSAFHAQHDVTDEARWQEIVGQAETDLGGLNVLVNNAGIGGVGSIERETYEGFQRVMTVDVDSIFLGCKAALPLMKQHGLGSIVNISSIAGLIADENFVSYNTAKSAVWMMSKSIALHAARIGGDIRCNSVHPAFIETAILDGFVGRRTKEESRAMLAKQVPLNKIGDPDDIAYAVLYLASDESKFVTGAEFKVDGGISAM